MGTPAQQYPNDFYHSSTFRIILLMCMTLQNSATVLVGRYTRSAVPKDELYNINHFIITCEIGKVLLSCLFEYVTTNGQLIHSLRVNVYQKPYDALKIMVPALLYLVQNSLLYVALGNLSAPLFQVTYQTKVVTTAVVSVVMLNRKYSLQQWICLVILSIGVTIVILGEQKDGDTSTVSNPHQSLTIGLAAVTIACLSSALAGVYFEKVVKTASNTNVTDVNGEKPKPVSVWMRNIQLAFFSICTALLQTAYQSFTASNQGEDGEVIIKGYFHGFTVWTWVLVGLQSGGGLLVAAVIKYADNVLKGLATGVSVCLSTAVSTILFSTSLSGQFSLGSILILASVYLFSNPLPGSKSRSLSPSSPRGTTEMKPILPK